MADKILKQTLTEITRVTRGKFTTGQWPTPACEEWRRTNLAKYDLSGFTLQLDKKETSSALSPEAFESDDFAIHIRKVSGASAEIKISKGAAEDILVYDPLYPVAVDKENANLIVKAAEYAADCVDNRTGNLALSSFKDSIFLIIPDNLTMEKPIIVEFNSTDGNETFLPNLFISAGKEAEVQIIQKITATSCSNISGQLNVLSGSNSNIHTATVTDTSDDSIMFLNRFFDLSKESFLSDFQSYTGSKLIKTRTEVGLAGRKADARLFGIVISGENSHIDMRTVQHHKEKDCFSQAVIKSIVSDKGRSIYQGLIEVEEDASLTDAYLTNHNIVLNSGARADSIPSLKIRNNDVKCSHGSTTGKINEEQILYLTSRGLDREEAMQMILEGFLSQVYDQLSVDIKSYCSPFLMDKLRQKEAVTGW